MVNRPKQKGTAAETAVAKYLVARGFTGAERRPLHGSVDKGDVRVTRRIIAQVKAGKMAETASENQLDRWLEETTTQAINAGEDFLGILVTKAAGVSGDNAHNWYGHTTLAVLNYLQGNELTDPCVEDIRVSMRFGNLVTVIEDFTIAENRRVAALAKSLW